jgi:hypothetical protein
MTAVNELDQPKAIIKLELAKGNTGLDVLKDWLNEKVEVVKEKNRIAEIKADNSCWKWDDVDTL